MKFYLLSRDQEDFDRFIKDRGGLPRHQVVRVQQVRDLVGIGSDITVGVLPCWEKDFWVPADITDIREQLQHGKMTRGWCVIYFQYDGKGGFHLPPATPPVV